MASDDRGDSDRLLTPAEVAGIFGVDVKTVTRWARSGKLPHVRTLGGHRRYSEREVRDLRAQGEEHPFGNQVV